MGRKGASDWERGMHRLGNKKCIRLWEEGIATVREEKVKSA